MNDLFGHIVGDNVLSQVADLIVTNAGDNAYIGRYGGEEFIAILPNTVMDEAAAIAENVRYSVQEHHFFKEDMKVTISIGLVQYAGETTSILFNKADMLLYQAKHNGRNRLKIS